MSIGESRISIGCVVVADTFAYLKRHNRRKAFASLIPTSHDFVTGSGMVLESITCVTAVVSRPPGMPSLAKPVARSSPSFRPNWCLSRCMVELRGCGRVRDSSGKHGRSGTLPYDYRLARLLVTRWTSRDMEGRRESCAQEMRAESDPAAFIPIGLRTSGEVAREHYSAGPAGRC
jgi:hypothetical protein